MLFKFGINYFLFFSMVAVSAPYLQVLLRSRGFSSLNIGLLLGIFEVTGIAGPILAGLVSEKIGRYRFVLLILAAGSGIAFFILGRTEVLWTASAALVVFGTLYRPIPSLQDALSSRSLSNPLRDYGIVRIGGSLGFIGTSLFIQFSGILNFPTPGRIVVVFITLTIMFFISTMTVPEVEVVRSREDGHRKRDLRSFFSFPAPFWAALLTVFFIKFGLSGYYSFFSLFLKESYGITSISGIWAVGAIAEIPMILWGSRLISRFGYKNMLVLAVLGAALRMFIYSAGLPISVVIAAQVLHAFSFGLIHITVVSVINHSVPEGSRTAAMSVYGGIGFGLAGFTGSVVSGYVLENSGFVMLYIFCGVVTLLPAAVILNRKYLIINR